MKLIIVGKAASGKDFLRKRLMDKGMQFGVSHTTRPPRVGEENGRDYFFVSEEEFLDIVNRGNMVEYQKFNGWYYGMAQWIWNEADVVILNADAVSQLSDEIKSKSLIIYLDIEREIREKRMVERKDADDSLPRRMDADEEQFHLFNNYDIRVANHDF